MSVCVRERRGGVDGEPCWRRGFSVEPIRGPHKSALTATAALRLSHSAPKLSLCSSFRGGWGMQGNPGWSQSHHCCLRSSFSSATFSSVLIFICNVSWTKNRSNLVSNDSFPPLTIREIFKSLYKINLLEEALDIKTSFHKWP